MITYKSNAGLSEMMPQSGIPYQVDRKQAEELVSKAAEQGITVPSADDLMAKWRGSIGDALTALEWGDEFEFVVR